MVTSMVSGGSDTYVIDSTTSVFGSSGLSGTLAVG